MNFRERFLQKLPKHEVKQYLIKERDDMIKSFSCKLLDYYHHPLLTVPWREWKEWKAPSTYFIKKLK